MKKILIELEEELIHNLIKDLGVQEEFNNMSDCVKQKYLEYVANKIVAGEEKEIPEFNETVAHIKESLEDANQKTMVQLKLVYAYCYGRSYERTFVREYGQSWKELGILGTIMWILHKSRRMRNTYFDENGNMKADPASFLKLEEAYNEDGTLFGHLVDILVYCALSITLLFERWQGK